jgi:hypothetical protein
VFGGKARRKETTRKTRCRLVDNIKMVFGVIGLGDMDWTDVAQGISVEATCERSNEPFEFHEIQCNFLSNCTSCNLSGRAQLNGVILNEWKILEQSKACLCSRMSRYSSRF